MGSDEERIPVIVGVGRKTWREDDRGSPLELAREGLELAAKDSGVGDAQRLIEESVGIGTVQMFLEIRWRVKLKRKFCRNFSRSLADEMNMKDVRDEFCVVSKHGGNAPQFMVNLFGDMISSGELPQGPVFIGGCEFNASFDRLFRNNNLERLHSWELNSSTLPYPTYVNQPLDLLTKSEKYRQVFYQSQICGVGIPLITYPMFENASIEHEFMSSNNKEFQSFRKYKISKYCETFSKFSKVAHQSPDHSWFPIFHSKETLENISAPNRMLNYPYSKLLVSRDEVDQTAFVCMMSLAEAKRRNIPQNKIIFLHSSGDCYEEPCVPLRQNFTSYPAMNKAYSKALGGVDPASIPVLDIYSCFPIAVSQAVRALGVKDQAGVSLTQTGGLPYHGGPGSNYSTHGLCAVVEKVRNLPGVGFGLVGANGGNLTEHSVGLYSSEKPEGLYSREPMEEYAHKEGEYSLSEEEYDLKPQGEVRILMWTVEYGFDSEGNNVPRRGVVIGDLVKENRRCVGVSFDKDTVEWMLEDQPIGKSVYMQTDGKKVKVSEDIEVYVPTFRRFGEARL